MSKRLGVLKAPRVFLVFRDLGPSDVRVLGIHPDADIVELLVSKQPPVVAIRALGLFGKYHPPVLLLIIESGLVAILEGDETGILRGRHDRPHERGDGIGDVIRCCGAAKDGLELFRIPGDLVERGANVIR